jgi:cell division protein FtsW
MLLLSRYDMNKTSIFSKIDKPLLFFAIIYSIIGMIMVLSASSVSAVLKYDQSPYYFFIRQSVFIVASYFVGFFIVLRFPLKKYKKYVPLALLGILISLIYLIIYGEFTNSARSWIDLGPFRLQPSEFAKSVIVIYMGIFYGDIVKKVKNKYSFFIPLAYSIIVFLLVVLQPDLGTALIIGGIVFLTFFAIPFEGNQLIKTLKIVSGTIVVCGIVFLMSGTDLLTDMQKSRLTYKAPCTRYTEDTGYQVCNGFIAINNGGFFGKGLGNSTQKYLYLPEAHTDFIFPIMVEELGLVFGIVFLLGYLFILYRIVKIAKESLLLRNSIICYGVAVYILLHIIVNFCGILALIPLTGVPVPFLSYGGSFTVNLILCIFVVERICVENKISRRKMEISKI